MRLDGAIDAGVFPAWEIVEGRGAKDTSKGSKKRVNSFRKN